MTNKPVRVCGLPLSVHVRGTVIGLMSNGIGGGCEDTYKALLEVAEAIKREFGYADYQPSGDMCGEFLGPEQGQPEPFLSPGSNQAN